MIHAFLLSDAQATAKVLGESAFAVALEAGKRDSVEALAGAVVKQASGIDLLVENAVMFEIGTSMISPKSLDRTFTVNVDQWMS